MQEETFSILYQKMQNVWSNKSVYTLKVLPNRMKQITKWYAIHVKVVVENWRLKAEAKGTNAENEKIFEKLVAFLN